MNYKERQKQQTQIEINRLLSAGCEKISLEEYKSILLNKFGLKLCLDPKNYLLKYYNTHNAIHYLHASTSAEDKTGFSWCNVSGCFYKENIVKDTELYSEFKEFRNTYFVVLKSGHILDI